MHLWSCIFKLYLAAICVVCFFACSGGSSTSKPVEDGEEELSSSSGQTEAPGDSAGYTRVITETGDTIYVKDTVTIYPDTTLRWVGNSALVITEIASLNLNWLDLDGDDPSWVEIYNAGTESANLKGWALVENLKSPKKWVFGDEVIAAKSMRTVFCDKKDIATVAGLRDTVNSEKDSVHYRTHTNWKLDKDGGTVYLVDPSNGIRDSVAYPELVGGVSWGIVDGGAWKYFGTPTPEKPNTAATAYDGMAPSVDFGSVKAGFYPSEVTFSPPDVEAGVTLRCTTDGSAPTASSEVFNAPKTFSKNTSLRCSAFKDGTLTREVITNTIFVGESVNMPVVAVSVDPVFFEKYYKKTDGGQPDMDHDQMYAPNKSYPEDPELPVHVEYFENGSKSSGKAWEIDAGISLMGGWSRMERKKSVAIVMREEYQSGWLHYPLFEPRRGTDDKYKAFNLRNNGNRFVADYFADAVGGAILEGSHVDYQRSRQVVVYYNGKYYGIHDMRERFNKNYVETNYGIDAGTVNFIKHLNKSITASNGTTDDYKAMLTHINTKKMDNTANYEKAKTLIDVGNFADYMVAEMYVHNGDWPDNNVRAWRSPDQPWKFMVYDLDHGFNWRSDWAVGGFSSSKNMFEWVRQGGKNGCSTDTLCFAGLFNHLIKNSDFKRLFINHAAVMLENYLNGKNVAAKVSFLAGMLDASDVADDMADSAYENRRSNYGTFDPYGETLVPWAESRDSKFLSEIQSEFGLGSLVSMTISSSGNGYVLMEGMKLPGTTTSSTNYSGNFFSGTKMELTAIPSGSAVFMGWDDESVENPRIVDVKAGATYKAKFSK